MKNIVKIFALGGLDENGKNLYVLEINSDIFVFEAGLKFPETLSTGVDMIIPDISYLEKNKKRVKAYFISHGHDDIMGALPYLIQKVPAPVYCTRVTQYMIEDTATRFNQDVKFDFHIVKSEETITIAGHEVIFFSTTHSISESLGIAVETGNGLVVYTGDFIIDYEALPQFRTDINLLSRIGDRKVLCLMTESIACDKGGHTSPNHKITPIIEPIFSEKSGRIILSFYSQNMFGIREAIDLAIKYKRRIYVQDKGLQSILKNSTEFGTLMIPPYLYLRADEVNRPGNEDAVILIGGLGESVFLTLGKIAGGEDKYVMVRPTDNIVIASPSIPGLEVLSTKIIDELYKTGAKVTNIKSKQVVSMHARAEDIKMMISLLTPKYYLPVKGEYRNLVTNAQIAVGMQLGYNHTNVFVYDNGMVAYFEDGVYKGCSETFDLHEIMIDGLGFGDVGSSVITDRQKLADDGVLILGISVDSKAKEIVAGPDIQMRGLIFLKDADYFLAELVKTYESMVNEALNKNEINNSDTRVKIRDRLVGLVRRFTGKAPLILPVILDVQQK